MAVPCPVLVSGEVQARERYTKFPHTAPSRRFCLVYPYSVDAEAGGRCARIGASTLPVFAVGWGVRKAFGFVAWPGLEKTPLLVFRVPQEVWFGMEPDS